MTGRKAKRERRVRDVMVTDVVTIEPSASLVTAARRMAEANVGMLPVVDGERVVGVITDRDITVRAVARERDPVTTRVIECLSEAVIPAHPDWPTQQAIVTMAQAQVGRLPVLDDEQRLVGVVTLSSMAFRSRHKAVALEAAQEISRRSAREAA
jgi:CBS domain-containing protein